MFVLCNTSKRKDVNCLEFEVKWHGFPDLTFNSYTNMKSTQALLEYLDCHPELVTEFPELGDRQQSLIRINMCALKPIVTSNPSKRSRYRTKLKNQHNALYSFNLMWSNEDSTAIRIHQARITTSLWDPNVSKSPDLPVSQSPFSGDSIDTLQTLFTYTPSKIQEVVRKISPDTPLNDIISYIQATEVAINQLTMKQALRKYGRERIDSTLMTELDNFFSNYRVFDNTPVLNADHFHRLSVHFEEKTDLLTGVEQLKSRSCVDSHRQPDDPNLVTASPTVNPTYLNTFIAVCAKEGIPLSTTDVPAAFCQTDNPNTSDNSYAIIIPPDLAKAVLDKYPHYKRCLRKDGSLVVGLLRALYGLKEAARLWYEKMSRGMIEDGFVVSRHDPCIFYKGTGYQRIIVATHVDDFRIVR